MKPIEEHEARVGEAYRRRRRPLDIDPETGEEILSLLEDEEVSSFEPAEFDAPQVKVLAHLLCALLASRTG